MIAEDDLFVVIVDTNNTEYVHKADKNKSKAGGSYLYTNRKESKCNMEQDRVENILYAAQAHGEILHLDHNIEKVFKVDFDTYYDTIFDDDDDEPQFICEDDQSSVGNTESDNDQFTLASLRYKNIIKDSYVQKLRKKFPSILSNNKEDFVQVLVQKMKNEYPPEPPPNYFTYDEGDYRCNFCDIESPTENIAKKHYQEKHGERYLFCYACGSTFRCKNHFYRHEKRSCQSPDISIVLKARALFLGRRGRSRPFLPYISNEPRERCYSCTECTATFASKCSLESHLRMHRGERPFICSQCPLAYTSQVALTLHMRKHSETNLICDYCGKIFKERENLVVHLNSHAPMKRFRCEECPKQYSTKADLIVHVNSHHRNLPLPYDCKICPKRFARMGTLKCHMKRNHGMIIMTSRMFARHLPKMSTKQLETQLQQAIIIRKNPDASDSV